MSQPLADRCRSAIRSRLQQLADLAETPEQLAGWGAEAIEVRQGRSLTRWPRRSREVDRLISSLAGLLQVLSQCTGPEALGELEAELRAPAGTVRSQRQSA